jgi:outer membrane protein
VANAKAQVANAVGLRVNTALTLEPWPAVAPVETISHSVEQLLAQAKTARPDLIAAQAKVQAAQGQVQAAAGQGRPSLSLTAGAGQAHFRDAATVAESNIGLTLRVPLFAGFRTAYSISQAKAQVEQTEAQRDQLLSQVQLQVWQAYFNQQTAAVTIKSAGALLRSATQAAQVAQARYRAGVGTILEVLNTQAAEANANVQNIQAQLNWYVGLAQLGHAVGTLQTNGGYVGRP